MARLTWNDVQAPDFSNAMEGFRQASSLFNGAFTAARQGLQGFERERGQEAERALAIAAMQYQDPALLQAAIADGTIFADIPQARLGVDALRDLDRTVDARFTRQGQVLQNEQTRGNIDWSTYQRGRERLGDVAEDRLAPFVAQGAQAAATGDVGGLDMAMEGARAAGFEGLSPEQIRGFYSGNQDLFQGFQGARQGELTYKQGQLTYDEAVKSRDERDQADRLWRDLITGSIDGEGARQLLYTDDKFKNISGGVFNTLLGRINGQYGSQAGGSAPGAGGGGPLTVPGNAPPGTDPTRVMNYEARAGGFSVVPASVTNLGQASDFALTINRAGVGSSAMGTYQITGQTLREFAPRVFGENWRTIDFNQDNQDKVAEAIFNASRGSAAALRGRWVSLSPAEAERVRQMPWSQARAIIAQKESGGLPAGASPEESQAAAILAGQIPGLGNQAGAGGGDVARATGFAQAQQNAGLNINQVTDNLIGQDGLLAGVPRNRVHAELQYFMNKHNVSASVAAWAIGDSLRARSPATAALDFFTTGGNEDFNGQRIDRGAGDAAIRSALSGDLAAQTQTTLNTQQLQASLATAVEAQRTATANLQWAMQQNALRGGTVDITRYRLAKDQADAQVAALTTRVRTDPTAQPRTLPQPPSRQASPPRRTTPRPTPPPRTLTPRETNLFVDETF